MPAYTIYSCRSQHPIEEGRNMLRITVTIGRGEGVQVHYKEISRKSSLGKLIFS